MSRSTCDHESHTNTGIPSGPRLSDTDAFAWKRWEIVAWLFAAYFLHQADKQIYSVVLTPIQKEFGLSGFQSGLIGTAFTLVVAFVSPLAGCQLAPKQYQ